MSARALVAHVYRTVYRPDRLGLLAIVGVVVAALAVYVALSGAAQRLADATFAGASTGELVGDAAVLALVVVALVVLSLLELVLISEFLICRAIARIQPILLGHVLAWPFGAFETRSPGDLRDVIVNLTTSAATSTASLARPLAALVRGVFLLFLMAQIDIALTVVAALTIAVYAVFFVVVQRPVAAAMDGLTEAERASSAAADDLHRNATEIRRNALDEPALGVFDRAAAPYFAHSRRYFRRVNLLGFGGDLLLTMLPVALLVATSAGIGDAGPGDFVAVYTLSVLLVGLFRSLQTASRSVLTGAAHWRTVLGLLDIPAERCGGLAPSTHDVQWDDVTATRRDRTVLDGVSLVVRAGEKVVVIGRSGTGKTTTLLMLTGLLEPDGGRVLVGGVDVRRADPRALRSGIAVVDQDPYLFDATVGHNLDPDGCADEDHLAEVLSMTRLDDVVATLPAGLDTHIGPGGHAVSGGERARLALARALLRRPEVLVLDETFAHLDSETEEAITARLVDLPCTILAVTHRLPSLAQYERVVGIDGGRVTIDGPTPDVLESADFERLFEPADGSQR